MATPSITVPVYTSTASCGTVPDANPTATHPLVLAVAVKVITVRSALSSQTSLKAPSADTYAVALLLRAWEGAIGAGNGAGGLGGLSEGPARPPLARKWTCALPAAVCMLDALWERA